MRETILLVSFDHLNHTVSQVPVTGVLVDLSSIVRLDLISGSQALVLLARAPRLESHLVPTTQVGPLDLSKPRFYYTWLFPALLLTDAPTFSASVLRSQVVFLPVNSVCDIILKLLECTPRLLT